MELVGSHTWTTMGLSSVLNKRLTLGVDTAAATGSGKEASVPFSSSSIKKRREEGANSSKATPPAGRLRKYIKTLSVLTILTVIMSTVIVGVAIMTASKKFNVDNITENDVPIPIGAGIGQTSVMAALYSTISPMDLLQEIDLNREKKQKEDEIKNRKKNNKNNYKKYSTSSQKSRQKRKRKTKTKHPRGRKTRTRAMRSRKMPVRSIRKSPKGLRFLRGLLRLLIKN